MPDTITPVALGLRERERESFRPGQRSQECQGDLLDPREQNLLNTLQPIIALQTLAQARAGYLTQVIEYNKAQFRLYVALGQPPAEALLQAASVPVSVPVAPVKYQPATPPPKSPLGGNPQK